MSEDPYKLPHPSPLRQIALSLILGVTAAAIAYAITSHMAKPDQAVGSVQTQGAYKFVYYMTALAGGMVFMVTMRVYKTLADIKYKKSLEPAARVVSSGDKKNDKTN